MKHANEPMCLISEKSITISTACRLHLGLMEICDQEPNLFGGIGLMAQEPSTRIEGIVGTVTEITELEIVADSYWSPRIKKLCERWRTLRNEVQLPLKKIVMHQCAPQHCGLGSGTQVASAVVTILEQARDGLAPSLEQLKSLTGRGVRSCVGLQGFMEGGFIVDYGQSKSTERRSVRLDFPCEWPLLLVRVSQSIGDSGEAELHMFHQCASHANPNRFRMMSLIEEEIIPAVQSQDWNRWDLAVGQYGYYAGDIFSRCQGGIYRTPDIGRLVDCLANHGCFGAAQSSWGPTVLVVAKDLDHAWWLRDSIAQDFPNAQTEFTTAQNHAASLIQK